MPESPASNRDGFDVIGDVHGCCRELVELLVGLGYSDDSGAFRHPSRQVIFVGDLIDRGPQQVQVLRTVRAMVEAGSAQVVMGNHEFNAIAYATPHPGLAGEHLRPRRTCSHRTREPPTPPEAFLAPTYTPESTSPPRT